MVNMIEIVPATMLLLCGNVKHPGHASTVVVCHCFLLGCVDFLEQLAMAFVRLDEAVLLESVLEVPVPVRFIFVLLGPSQSSVDYHEIGRSFATLMSDKVALVPPGERHSILKSK